MPSGSCFCGSCLCHCYDCRKIGGSTYSVNLIIPDSAFTLLTHSTLKSVSKLADSGKKVEQYFCGNCGTTLYSLCVGMPGVHIIKAGTLDDINGLDDAKPVTELFVSHRVCWVPAIPDSKQAVAMQ
ncbi:Mss4-like protein [Lipomyces tetrasporus]|uniref:Mss4-like protein n=1 Tax=Lipomyces tetrasporus TaxID=54092 RepID=A0AAD7QK35_9ASCO|nr:Mss4-like protein [Lipomyces tetrasporus]KAJ8096498.1 Mss4-like protein [Lipomyces tetrasporus]